MELGKVELSTHCHGKPDGIELRDWFAGMALVGDLSSETETFRYGANKEKGLSREEVMAESCYRFADAMMKARGKGGQ